MFIEFAISLSSSFRIPRHTTMQIQYMVTITSSCRRWLLPLSRYYTVQELNNKPPSSDILTDGRHPVIYFSSFCYVAAVRHILLLSTYKLISNIFSGYCRGLLFCGQLSVGGVVLRTSIIFCEFEIEDHF